MSKDIKADIFSSHVSVYGCATKRRDTSKKKKYVWCCIIITQYLSPCEIRQQITTNTNSIHFFFFVAKQFAKLNNKLNERFASRTEQCNDS